MGIYLLYIDYTTTLDPYIRPCRYILQSPLVLILSLFNKRLVNPLDSIVAA